MPSLDRALGPAGGACGALIEAFLRRFLARIDTGALTVPRYLLESMLRGYWNNRFEIEALGFADANRSRLLAELSRAQPNNASRS